MNRALRAATVGVLLFSPLVITACSAGQVNQTSSQLRDKVGPQATIGDLELRGVQLAYPTDGTYSPGDDAELQMAIVNNGAEDDTLTGITGTSFSRVRVTGSSSGTVAPGSSAATPTSAPASSSAGERPVDITIPADSSVFLGQTSETITLVSLGQTLTPAQTVELTFTFERAGDLTMQVPVAAPSQNVPQTSAYNFEQGENEGDEPGNEVSGGLPTQRDSGNGGG